MIANIKLLEGYISIKRFTFRELMLEIFMSNYNLHLSIEQFRAAMTAAGIPAPLEIQDDGVIHRFYIQGDNNGSKNGYYSFNYGEMAWGIFGSWKTTPLQTWCSKNYKKMKQKDRAKLREKIAEAKYLHSMERTRKQSIAANKAECIYSNADPAKLNHPYLVQKQIKAFCAHQTGNHIVLPITDFQGKLWSLQYISPNGKKWFLNNGSIAGHFIPVQFSQTNKQRILVCEGFATAATIAGIYTEDNVFSACNAGNLKSVASRTRHHFPEAQIIICADDDRLTLNNPGLTMAREAASAVNALCTSPNWPDGAPTDLTDFNDLACWLAATKEEII